MSTQVQSELDRIGSNVAAAYTAAAEQGADIPAQQNTDNLSETIGSIKTVKFTAQTLTDAQQAQARKNIGAASAEALDTAPTYDTFPSVAEVNAMSDWAVFHTRGFYSKNDGAAGTYTVKSSSGSLFVPYGTKYICPVNVSALTDRDIYVDQYGIRRGSADYADRNSEIMTSLLSVFQNGFTLHFGSGHYYFSSPITSSKHTIIKGVSSNACVSPKDVNYGTYLHFPNLADGEAALELTYGVVQDLGIIGNASVCDVSLDRTQTITNPNAVVTLVDTGTTYGIKMGSIVQNVRVRNCTYGIYSESGNHLIDGVDVRQCKIGISVGNDVKITNVQAWNVMTGIELRGSLASATNIRGDSIGKHLIECWKGKCLLSNIDGDYCVGSLIHYGGGTSFIHLGQAVACMGRVATKYAHSRSTTFDLQTIASGDYEYCSFVSVAPNTRVFGGYIDVVNVKSNVFDADEYDYVTPSSVISIGTGSTVKGLIVKCTVPSDADNDYFNKNVIKNLSTYAESANDGWNYVTDFDGKTIEDICFITPFGMAVSKRTVDAPDRQVETPRVLMDMVDTVEVLTPGINRNDNVWEAGYFAANGTETGSTGAYATQCFRNANYIPVEGGRSIAVYYDAATWNNNNKGKTFYIVEYDADKNVIVQRQSFSAYSAGNTTYALNANTAYIRIAHHKWADLGNALTDIKVAIYYAEDARKEYVEYGYDSTTTHKIKGDAVVLKSPNGTAYILSVADDGTLSATLLNPE